jgi:hypothetical protein
MSKVVTEASGIGREYEELEIEVGLGLNGEAEVRVLGSRFDRPREPFRPTYDVEELNRRLEVLDSLLLIEGSEDTESKRRCLAESIGKDLYDALFPGKVRQTLEKCLASLYTQPTEKNVGLRLRLSFGEAGSYLPEIVGLPWELLCSPEKKFPSSAPETPLVRHLDLSRPAGPMKIKPPLRILAVIASPRGLPMIDREEHEKVLRKACAQEGRLELSFLKPPTLMDLRETMGRFRGEGKPIHAVHFLGHGGFDESGEGRLNFENSDGSRDRVLGRVLAQSLAGFRELRLVVLSTCVGARMMRRHGQHPFSGTASALVAEGLPAVVGMQFSVSQAAASAFTHSFYHQLSDGRSLEEAVTEGRQRILGMDASTFEWASPVLFLRSRDGRVFDMETSPASRKHGEVSGADEGTDPGSVSKNYQAGRDIFASERDMTIVKGDSYKAKRDINFSGRPRG